MSEPVSEFPTLLQRIEQVMHDYVGSDSLGSDLLPEAVTAVHTLVTAGADYETERIPNAEMTPAQALAWLFDLPEDQRVRRMTELLDAHARAGHCFMMNHDGLQAQADEAKRLAVTYRTALGELTAMELGATVRMIIQKALAS